MRKLIAAALIAASLGACAPVSAHELCIEKAQHRAIYKFSYTDPQKIITYAEMYCS